MKNCIISVTLILLTLSACVTDNSSKTITTGDLLKELTDLNRLSYMPDISYKTIQYSSYDRRSATPYQDGWFENSDGFGGEPLPGFVKVLNKPDTSGIGEYMVCDIQGPGVIVRTWTAMINGELEVYLDDQREAIYSGPAQDFLWNIPGALRADSTINNDYSFFRQNDACYFPLPFGKSCKIVWRGDLQKLHFYHIQFRIYDESANLKTFTYSDLEIYDDEIREVKDFFSGLEKDKQTEYDRIIDNLPLAPGESVLLDSITGTKQISEFALSIMSPFTEDILRKALLSIYFDGSSIPQIHSPVGDFFGTAPGIDPFESLPFSVRGDSTMICRFPMPFKTDARIIIDNMSDDTINLNCKLKIIPYEWQTGRSMHFRAKWRTNHNLSASNTDIKDITYLMARGKGRFVGVAAFIKNPSNVPSSWGNWWGEGDEKIFVDDDIEPSVFGTGSEDYFNYSWSSSRLFDHMFCGQPRNDGPANRGFVTNYRYQVIDDMVFNKNFAFFMELFHHGRVKGVDYSRITYYYAPPETVDDIMRIEKPDIVLHKMPHWESPEAYLGSSGYKFIEAEDIASLYPADRLFKSYLWSGGEAFFNNFNDKGEWFKLRFSLYDETDRPVQITMAHTRESGKVKIYIEGREEETAVEIDLESEYRDLSRNHGLRRTILEPGNYSVIIENLEPGKNRVGVDFIWLPD